MVVRFRLGWVVLQVNSQSQILQKQGPLLRNEISRRGLIESVYEFRGVARRRPESTDFNIFYLCFS